MTSERLSRYLDYFDEILPEAACELLYRKPYELLFAVMLSAQTSDASVNRITPRLWTRFPTLESLASADRAEVESIIRSIGLFRHKAKNLILAAQMLLKNHQGRVPSDKKALMGLPGVGVKTAAVVRAELFQIPEIAVDTHVERIAKRLGFAQVKDGVTTVERKLRKILPPERYIKTHHQMIHFGRYHCPARGMRCYECPLVDVCREKSKNLTRKE
ncbi:MAG: endonuclease III [Bacilli bacterium]|jgi:endonuclease-3